MEIHQQKRTPYINIKARKDSDVSTFFGFKIESRLGAVWDLMGSGKGPEYTTFDLGDGWTIYSADIYAWAESMGITNPQYVTGMSYYVYYNGRSGLIYSYVDYISYGITSANSPKTGKASGRIFISESENYMISFKVAEGRNYGNFSLQIGNKEFLVNSHSDSVEQNSVFRFFSMGYLEKGYHNISITANSSVEIESFSLYSLRDSPLDAGTPAPSVVFKKIDPTRYKVHVENASAPFFLVFSSTYDKDWVAHFRDLNSLQTFSSERVPDEYHFMANGYANAWYINKTGTYTITLEFWPQKLFYIGSTISITTLTICVLYLSKNKIKTLYHYLKKKRRSRTSKTIL